MASGIFAVLDDIATLLDDAVVISKVAAKKTVGILGDDLAVNAEKATGFRASRELYVLWAITKGSVVNKLILLPMAFLLSAFLPMVIVPILLIGGAYLSFEGVEKIVHTVLSGKQNQTSKEPTGGSEEEARKKEKAKVSSAIRTDFILSIEIVIIALGTVMHESFLMQVIVVSSIALLATIGVYGLVALIVRMDDAGLYLIRKGHELGGAVQDILCVSGRILVAALPKVVRLLGIIGTIAMLLVGGGMFTHNIPAIHHFLESWHSGLIDQLAALVIGLITGGVLFTVVSLTAKVRKKPATH
ncbi:MAG: hypothetical protein CSA33_03950 [Desulfobulbus propionicus]|nr:MAG: hypothetical protein CSA33_03950 [Desulfobulbus propionicus]